MDNNSSKNTVRRFIDVYQATGKVNTSTPPKGGSGMAPSGITKPFDRDNAGSSSNKQTGGQTNNDK
ncbi:MAG: hypothetical protein JRJ49_04685 [Deltaproteobacteria bacterium]|nr:hypothetical protein [Deltaproteobacteria bacterium]